MNFSKEEWDAALIRLEEACKEVKADYRVLMTRNVGGDVEVGPLNAKDKSVCGKLILRRQPESVDDVIETRIAVVGNGQSSIPRHKIGMLTRSSRCREEHNVGRACKGRP